MKAIALYRTAGVLLFAAAAGNTYGLLNFWHVAGPMNPVRFPWGHSGFSYAQVVLGLEVFCSCVCCSGHIWPGIWAPWPEQRLKPLARWDGCCSRINSLGSI